MKASVIRQKYLDFFQKKPRSHKLIPPAPLVPPDDPTTLFTSSGMQQLIPYLRGQSHPMGKRLVDSQPCFRAEDIDEVGNNRHTTFFEMLGNWSLGDYFKQEQLAWLWEFLIKQLHLSPDNLYISVFKGNQDIPKDDTSAKIWQKLGVPKNRIYYYGVKQNWWSRSGPPDKMPPGEIGGPDSEVFFEFKQLKHDPKYGKDCHPNCQCGRFLEIANSVFIEYEKQSDGSFKPLPKKNVDFGGGLERLAAAVQNTPDIFQIADHLRGAVAMIEQGIEPSNKLHGYLLRRLIRRSAIKLRQLAGELKTETFKLIVNNQPLLVAEIDRFKQTLDRGLKLIDQAQPQDINPKLAFDLFQTYGFPFEITQEILAQKGIKLKKSAFDKQLKKHQQLSRTTSAGMFKGGLADQSGTTTKLHTATHLLHQALRQVLGGNVRQQGSNINPQRLRFDFSHPKSLTSDEIKQVETIVNQQIRANLPVKKTIQTKEKALASGALAFFAQTYPDKVTVYSIGSFSKELCGGPHVASTGEIGGVRIIKQGSIGASKRRLYAALKKPAH